MTINNFDLSFAAYLFPAIPLMMISFGNRYSSLSKLIRKIYDEFINKKIKASDKSAMRYLSQVKILNLRLRYIQSAQIFSGIAFLFNLLTIFVGILDFILISVTFFLFALSFFCFALIFFIIEIKLASMALKTHINDLEKI